MDTAPDSRRSLWSRAYQSARLLVDVIGVVTALSGTVLTAYYKISDYRSSCEAKGLEPFVCFGGSLGWVDIEALQQKNQKIATLQSELDRVRADVARVTTVASAEAADKQALAALREATEVIRQRDAKIADLVEKHERLTARYAALQRSTAGSSSGPSGGTGTGGSTPAAARPNPTAFSTTVWPSGTLPHGETRRATTQHGTLQCTGGNTNTGAPRSCVWLP